MKVQFNRYVESNGTIYLANNVQKWSCSPESEIRFVNIYTVGGGALDSLSDSALSLDGELLASDGDKTVKIWNSCNRQIIRPISHSKSITALDISPNGQMITSVHEDTTIKIWNLHIDEVIRTIGGHSEDVNTLAFSSNGWTLISSSDDGTIKVWR